MKEEASNGVTVRSEKKGKKRLAKILKCRDLKKTKKRGFEGESKRKTETESWNFEGEKISVPLDAGFMGLDRVMFSSGNQNSPFGFRISILILI